MDPSDSQLKGMVRQVQIPAGLKQMQYRIVVARYRRNRAHKQREKYHTVKATIYYSSFNRGIKGVSQLEWASESPLSITVVHSKNLLSAGFRDLPNGALRGHLCSARAEGSESGRKQR